jgi:lipopolysaccharide transport system ATP-binding protein
VKMPNISLNNVRLDFPVYNADSRSLKRALINTAVGGRLRQEGRSVNVTALENISLSVSSGDRVGLIGANGSGKTSLLKVLAGIYKPTGGSLQASGRIDSLLSINSGMDMEESAIENVYLRGLIMGLSKRQIDAKLDEILEFADLGDFVNLPIRTYSSGMMMRLAFSIVTSVKPEILLMDEWLSVGDADFKAKAQARISDMVESADALVIASHSRATIKSSCNRVIWLQGGVIKAEGEPDQVLEMYFGTQ